MAKCLFYAGISSGLLGSAAGCGNGNGGEADADAECPGDLVCTFGLCLMEASWHSVFSS